MAAALIVYQLWGIEAAWGAVIGLAVGAFGGSWDRARRDEKEWPAFSEVIMRP